MQCRELEWLTLCVRTPAHSGEVVAGSRNSSEVGPHALACPWTLEEITAGLRALANNKAAGKDVMPAELLECSGEAGAKLL